MDAVAEPVPLRRNVTQARVLAVRDGAAHERADRLATEEPMEIRAEGPGQDPVSVAVTMRTPGADFDLAVGFLFTEGLIRARDDVRKVSYCEDLDQDEQHYNVVTVNLARPFDRAMLTRNFYANSSCGIFGKASREDVGRHNAVDKIVGEAFLAGDLPLSERILLVSGRASFEIVQKAGVAGIPVVAAVSAPSSLAVDLAERLGQTVVGFVRDGRFNV